MKYYPAFLFVLNPKNHGERSVHTFLGQLTVLRMKFSKIYKTKMYPTHRIWIVTEDIEQLAKVYGITRSLGVDVVYYPFLALIMNREELVAWSYNASQTVQFQSITRIENNEYMIMSNGVYKGQEEFVTSSGYKESLDYWQRIDKHFHNPKVWGGSTPQVKCSKVQEFIDWKLKMLQECEGIKYLDHRILHYVKLTMTLQRCISLIQEYSEDSIITMDIVSLGSSKCQMCLALPIRNRLVSDICKHKGHVHKVGAFLAVKMLPSHLIDAYVLLNYDTEVWYSISSISSTESAITGCRFEQIIPNGKEREREVHLLDELVRSQFEKLKSFGVCEDKFFT